LKEKKEKKKESKDLIEKKKISTQIFAAILFKVY